MMILTDETWCQDSDTAIVLFCNFFNIHWFAEAVLEVLMNCLCTTIVLPLSKTVDGFL